MRKKDFEDNIDTNQKSCMINIERKRKIYVKSRKIKRYGEDLWKKDEICNTFTKTDVDTDYITICVSINI